jgi:hypothetical protein
VREVSIAAVVVEKATETRTAEEAAAAKVAEEATEVKVVADKAVVVKVAADKATMEKVDADKAATMMMAEEAMVKAATDATMMKTTDQGALAAKTKTESMGSRSDSSPGPAVGSKWMVVSGGSTPPSK